MTARRSSGLRLTVYLNENDTWHHRPLYHVIVERAHRAGLAGASVLRGIEGFAAGSAIHVTRRLSLAPDLPIVVVIVDSERRIRDFLPQLDELLTEGTVVLDEVEIVAHTNLHEPGWSPDQLP